MIDPNPILSLIDGYRCSKILFTAVDLKLFDHLVSQPLSLEELAKKLNLKHLSSLERCLNACVALKLLNREVNNQKYSNTKLSETYLVSTSPSTLNGYINHNNQSSYLIWTNLSNAIRDNAPQWKQTFENIQGDQFKFNAFYRDENAEITFMSGMHQLGLTCFPSVVECLDNSQKFKIICDIGGGTGCLAISACQANPHLRGIIFDLPVIEKHAVRCLNQISDDIRHRIHFQSGDFFHDSLPEADLFSLGRILHDWNDQQCEELLAKIYRRLPENNGAILIAEKLFNEDKTGPIDVITQDINMLLSTAGKERSASEYTNMLKKVGFKNIKCQKTGTYLDAIIAYK
jgi:acetylserotonin N-methyltransferase